MQAPQQPFQNFNFHNCQELVQTTNLKKILILQCPNYSYFQQFPVQIPYNSERRQLDIGYVISDIFKRVLGLQKNIVQVFYRSLKTGYYVLLAVYPFQERVYLQNDFIDQNDITIMFKTFSSQTTLNAGGYVCQQIINQKHFENLIYEENLMKMQKEKQKNMTFEQNQHKIINQGSSSNVSFSFQQHIQNIKQNKSGDTLSKKERTKDRTIGQVLQNVAKWRSIPQQYQKSKITLQQAAKMIKIPRKTLDDYYYQIKIGQNYGFNFEENFDKKIGVLRKFVRQNHKKKMNNTINISNNSIFNLNQNQEEIKIEQKEYSDLKVLYKYIYPSHKDNKNLNILNQNQNLRDRLNENQQKKKMMIEQEMKIEYDDYNNQNDKNSEKNGSNASPQCQFEEYQFEQQQQQQQQQEQQQQQQQEQQQEQ